MSQPDPIDQQLKSLLESNEAWQKDGYNGYELDYDWLIPHLKQLIVEARIEPEELEANKSIGWFADENGHVMQVVDLEEPFNTRYVGRLATLKERSSDGTN